MRVASDKTPLERPAAPVRRLVLLPSSGSEFVIFGTKPIFSEIAGLRVTKCCWLYVAHIICVILWPAIQVVAPSFRRVSS